MKLSLSFASKKLLEEVGKINSENSFWEVSRKSDQVLDPDFVSK